MTPLESVAEALRRLRRGEMVLVSDGSDREDEADLTIAAQWVDADAIAFMLRHGRGLVCMPCDGRRLDRLAIGPMVAEGACDTAFTVSIDHHAVGSGISAADRAATVRAVLDPWASPSDFVRPGHVFPLRARDGGVLVRPGHTEAAVDLAQMAGMAPCAVICEVLNDDGSVARGPDLDVLAARFDLARVSIDAIVAWRRSAARPPGPGVSPKMSTPCPPPPAGADRRAERSGLPIRAGRWRPPGARGKARRRPGRRP